MRVVPFKARYAARDPMQVWSTHAVGNPNDRDRNAEHAVPAEAAARPRDRAFFEAQNQLDSTSDLEGRRR